MAATILHLIKILSLGLYRTGRRNYQIVK